MMLIFLSTKHFIIFLYVSPAIYVSADTSSHDFPTDIILIALIKEPIVRTLQIKLITLY